jgi:type IV pilus assembly protein PilV
MKTTFVPGRRQQGVAMLEAMIAIVILAIGLLGSVGLQARSYSALSDASARAEATIAAEKLLGIMSNDAANVNSYVLSEGGTGGTAVAPWLLETKAAIPSAIVSVQVTQQTRRAMVQISIRWTRKSGAEENKHVLTSYVAV